jgi:hypothetical protein
MCDLRRPQQSWRHLIYIPEIVYAFRSTVHVQISLPAPWASVLFQKPTVAHVFKKFPPFMEVWKFIGLFKGFALPSYSVPLKHILNYRSLYS